MADTNIPGNGNKLLVHEVEIKHLTDAIADQTKLLNDMFGPNGLCFKKHNEIDKSAAEREKKISAAMTQTKWQWGAILGIGGALTYLYKVIIEWFQKGG